MHLIATLKAQLSANRTEGHRDDVWMSGWAPMEHVFAPLAPNYDKYLQTQAANAPISTVT